MTTMAITVGEGVRQAQGRLVQVSPPPVEGVIAALREQPQKLERWWSVHNWARAYRTTKGWESSIGVAVDLDYKIDDQAPTADAIARITDLATSGKMPGSLFHLTPHGARVVFVYEIACTHREMQIAASKGAASMVEQALAAVDLFDYVVDPCSWDLARLYFTPNSLAKGVARSAEIVLLRALPFEVDALIAEEPPEAEPEPTPAPPPRPRYAGPSNFDEAAERWVRDNRREYPKNAAPCPVCGDKASFGTLPDSNGLRWCCFSTDHPDGVGIRGNLTCHGDALDLEAHERGCKPVDVLRRDGYLPEARPRRQEQLPAPAETPAPTAASEIVTPMRPLRARSYLTAVQIVQQNGRDVLGARGAKIELNEMSGKVEIGRRPISDVDVHRVRGEIEARFVGGLDKNGNEIGLQLSFADVYAACQQVAAANSYHPVRDYLGSLGWDCVERIAASAEDILGAARTPLNQAMVRCFMVSAVARAFNPGCKVDTMLILVGKQGARKSTYFKMLAGDWIIDTPVDVHNKDSYQVLRGAWIYEWAELSVLRRARDKEACKAFITSPCDDYRPSHERSTVKVPRSSIIGGTTNIAEFLDDEENRRYHPLTVGMIDTALLAAQRDQLWAEAVAIYQRWNAAGRPAHATPWVLTAAEEAELAILQDGHIVSDAWDDAVVTWAESRVIDFTTADVLAGPLEKPTGQWNRGDEMRVAAVLKRAGWKLGHKPAGKARPWVRK